MSDGSGCETVGHHCDLGGASPSNNGGDAGYGISADGHSPIANLKQLTINGAPVKETLHEYITTAVNERCGKIEVRRGPNGN